MTTQPVAIMERIHVRIRRQDGSEGLAYWEEFRIPVRRGMNVISVLKAIADDPVTADGLQTTPVVWEQSCLEEVCGACSMLINGKVRQACATMVDDQGGELVLEPLSSFPVVRDLMVDRASLFDALEKMHIWCELDGLHDDECDARESPERARRMQLFSSCILCGCCVEACPQVNERSPYAGAYLIAQVLHANDRQTSSDATVRRLEALKGPTGIAGCGNAQNCRIVCPKGIPLGEAIGRAQWEVLKHSLRCFLRG